MICIFGVGYVGLSLATLISQKYEVNLIDLDENKVDSVNGRISPIKDNYIEKYFKEKN